MNDSYQLTTRKFTRENITQAVAELYASFVIPGLSKGKVGFLNGPPNIGKSYFLQTLAYEVTLAYPLIGIIDSSHEPKRVLFLCQEDGLNGFLARAENQIAIFNDAQMDTLEQNLVPATLPNSLISRNGSDATSLTQVESLIAEARKYDLIIIDTARKVMGSGREVEEDKLFESTLDKIAERADVAILVSHHLTKAHADRNQKLQINATGGSGLSSTQASSKYHLTLYYSSEKNVESKLWHSKFNYVPKHNFIPESAPIKFTCSDLDLFISPSIGVGKLIDIDRSPKKTTKEPSKELQSNHDDRSMIDVKIIEEGIQPENIIPDHLEDTESEKPLLNVDPVIEIKESEQILTRKQQKILKNVKNLSKQKDSLKPLQSTSDDSGSPQQQPLGLFGRTEDHEY